MHEWIRRLEYLLNRRRFDQELRNDLEFHREMAAKEGGMPVGNLLLLREEARDAWGWTWMERLSQDLRYAARQLRRSPGFTLAAILMLALGIGVNVAAFGFFNLMVLRPLPVRSPETLLRFKRRAPKSYAWQLPYPEMAFFRQYSKTLSAVLAVMDAKLAIEGEPKPLTADFVTANFFSELGARPMLGRVLDVAEDGAADSAPVVVLSQGFWRRHFGADPLIIGKTIRLNDKPAIVLGIAPQDFSGLSMDNPDVWLPINQQPYFVTGSHLFTDFSVDAHGITMFGRLQPGLSAATAENELASLAAVLHQQHPADIWETENLPSSPGGYAKNLGGGRHGTGTERSDEADPLMALVGSLTLLILAVACGNLGSLLLARGVAREREIAIRKAVGAGSGRLIRQLFTESLLLALQGAIAGLALGYLVLRGMMLIAKTPAWLNPAPDWRVVLFAVGIGFSAATMFGLTPALQAVRQRQRANRTRQVLMGAQIAASCVLVIVSALLVRALDHAMTTNPGFEYQQVVSIDPGLAAHGYSASSARTYLNTLQSRLRKLPGVESVSMTSSAPLGNRKAVTGADVGGRPLDVHLYAIDPEFFGTMKIPLIAGRNLTRSDGRAVVISKSFAQQWPEGDPLGRPFQMGDTSYTIVGIAGSARLVALQDPDAVEAYYLAGDADLSSMVVLLRTAGPPEGLAPFVASLARSIDPKIFPDVQLVKSSFNRKMEGAGYAAVSVSVLGFVALLLASLGIVGLVGYSVSHRTKEIGIRVALGASSIQVLSVVVRQLALPIVAGALAGVTGAAALSQLLRRELYGISNLDPIAYLGAIGVFVAMIAVAALLPARRALRVDPLQSLRYEG
ncbi:MAG TPA: ABC transporter permease [Bryobacteraceae bacterium]|nr:ABC transporter permease [Bryobacteraceae bacterium]